VNINSPITVEALKVLDAIDKRGSYAAAAEELDKVPSALSYVVQKLEEQLDVTLFQKQGRRSVLTPAGQYLLDEGRNVLNSIERMAEHTQNIARGYESKIRVAIDTVLNTEQVYTVFHQFLERFPHIEIDVQEHALNGTWEALIHDRIDLAIGAVDPVPQNKGIRAEVISDIDLVCVAAPNHPLASNNQTITPEQIDSFRRVVTHDTAQDFVTWTRGLPNASSPSAQHFYVPNAHSKRNAQLAGLGVGYLPRTLISEDLKQGRLVELALTETNHVERSAYMAWKLVNRGKGLQQLRSLIQKHFKQ